MEICLDCKDKVVKFYHFKRRAKELQKQHIRPTRQNTPQQHERQSKIVHNIVKIVENYTEKCSISTITIDESSKKLIIESQEESPKNLTRIPIQIKELPLKEEPSIVIQENSCTEDDSVTFKELNDEDCGFQHYDSSEPGTSASVALGRSRALNESEFIELPVLEKSLGTKVRT